MRGQDAMHKTLFTFYRLDDFVPSDHRLPAILNLMTESLGRLSRLSNTIYADTGSASIPPRNLCVRC